MFPLLAQVQFDVTQLVVQLGLTGFVIFIFVVGTYRYSMYRVKKTYSESQADINQQNTMTSLAVDYSKQMANMHNNITSLQSKMLEMSEQRSDLRETIAEVKGDLQLANYRIIELDGKVRQQDKKIAHLEEENKNISMQRNKFQKQVTELEKADVEKTELIAYLQGENTTLKLENARYKEFQSKADTQDLPKVEVEEHDGNLSTPILTTQQLNTVPLATDSDNVSIHTNDAEGIDTSNKPEPSIQRKDNDVPEAN